MKKFLTLISLSLMFLASSYRDLLALGSGAMYAAPKAQIAFGFGKFHDYNVMNENYTINPGLGGGLIFGYCYSETVAMEGDVSYLYWFTDTPKAVDLSLSAIPFSLGLKLTLNPMFSVIFGGGAQFQISKTEIEITPGVKTKDTEKKLWGSGYAGVEVNLQNLLLRPKYVYVYNSNEPSHSLQVEVAYLFDFEQ